MPGSTARSAASATATGEIVDIYDAAGIPKLSLSELGPDFTLRAQKAENPHLAIEALRDLLTEEVAKATGHSLVRQRAFSERIKELMNKYANRQLTSAEVIAELIEMAKEIAEGDRGRHFSPPLSQDALAFYDTVSLNESAVAIQGEDVLAQIARELVGVMRRDVKTDWMVRDDVRVLSGFLPVEQGGPAWPRCAPTASRKGTGDPRTREQIMADTLVERVTGQTAAGDVSAEVALVIPVDALTDRDGPHTAEVLGHGPIPAELATDVLAGSSGRRWWRRPTGHTYVSRAGPAP